MKIHMGIAALACLTLFACDRGEQQPRSNLISEETETIISTSGDESLSEADRQILLRIRQILQNDSALNRPARTIQITVSNGEVTIRGLVTNRQDREAIVNRIRQIAGIRNVNNHIELSGTGRETSYILLTNDSSATHTGLNANDTFSTTSDRSILQTIRDTFLNDSALAPEANTINIKVHNGNVTLTGTITSEKLRALITSKVKRVNLVKNVDNQLKVNSTVQNSSRTYKPYDSNISLTTKRSNYYLPQKTNQQTSPGYIYREGYSYSPRAERNPSYRNFEQTYNYPTSRRQQPSNYPTNYGSPKHYNY